MEEQHSEILMHAHVCVHCKLHADYSLGEISCTRSRPQSQNSFEEELHGHECFEHIVLELVYKEKVGSKNLNDVGVSDKQSLKRD